MDVPDRGAPTIKIGLRCESGTFEGAIGMSVSENYKPSTQVIRQQMIRIKRTTLADYLFSRHWILHLTNSRFVIETEQ